MAMLTVSFMLSHIKPKIFKGTPDSSIDCLHSSLFFIQISFNAGELVTHCLKFMLADFKISVAFIEIDPASSIVSDPL